MKDAKLPWAVLLVVWVAVPDARVQAQPLDAVGNRAAAIAAFVAVADDASAVAWNPAGLVFGPIFNVSFGLGRSTSGPDDPPAFPARAGRAGTSLVTLGLPPLGLFYLRQSSRAILTRSPAAGSSPDREDRQVLLRSVVTSSVGATVLQSLGEYVTFGATARLIRGAVGSDLGVVSRWADGFDRAGQVDTESSTAFDLDGGVIVAAGHLRAGLVVRNLLEPTFEGRRGETATLRRHARVGAAWGDEWPGTPRTIVAVDLDATRVEQPDGDRRNVAGGVERWVRDRRLGLRGGLRASTVGPARPIVSGGASYAVRAGTFVDAYVARGRNQDRGWGVGVRVAY